MSAAGSGKQLDGALGLLHRLEDGLLALILGLLVLLAPLQLFLRNFFDAGISWGDPLLRVLVLWVAMLGALAATRGRRQISIDVLAHVSGFDITGINDGIKPGQDVNVTITRADGSTQDITVKCRIDTLDEVEYHRHGGILSYVLRNLNKA